MVKVLFVCLGNICRSPTAHGVFEHFLSERKLGHLIEVDSAGTGAWHVGEAPDRRAQAAARQRGYRLDHLRARQVDVTDFNHFDYILAMDTDNLGILQQMKPATSTARVELFLSYAAKAAEMGVNEVPDPYYGGEKGFDYVLDLVESGSEGLLEHILSSHPDSP